MGLPAYFFEPDAEEGDDRTRNRVLPAYFLAPDTDERADRTDDHAYRAVVAPEFVQEAGSAPVGVPPEFVPVSAPQFIPPDTLTAQVGPLPSQSAAPSTESASGHIVPIICSHVIAVSAWGRERLGDGRTSDGVRALETVSTLATAIATTFDADPETGEDVAESLLSPLRAEVDELRTAHEDDGADERDRRRTYHALDASVGAIERVLGEHG